MNIIGKLNNLCIEIFQRVLLKNLEHSSINCQDFENLMMWVFLKSGIVSFANCAFIFRRSYSLKLLKCPLFRNWAQAFNILLMH